MARTKVTITAVGGKTYTSYLDKVAETASEESEQMDAACAAADVAGIDVSAIEFETVQEM